jgi:hypothetical protein
VPRDGDGSALAGKRRVGVVAGSLAQGRGPDALDHHVGAAQRRHRDAAEGVSSPDAAFELLGGGGQIARERRAGALELTLECRLAPTRERAGDRLLPEEGDRRVQDEQGAADHENRGEEAKRDAKGRTNPAHAPSL